VRHTPIRNFGYRPGPVLHSIIREALTRPRTIPKEEARSERELDAWTSDSDASQAIVKMRPLRIAVD
jgi:hypothetical protein